MKPERIPIPEILYGKVLRKDFSAFLNHGDAIYIVLTHGRVASKSICEALASVVDAPIYHLHYLNKQTLLSTKAWFDEATGFETNQMPALVDGLNLRTLMECNFNNLKWKVISLVRDPVEWQLSMIFELGATAFPDVFCGEVFDMKKFREKAMKALLEPKDTEFPLNILFYEAWWETELLKNFGMMVDLSEFNRKSGWDHYEKGNVSISVLQYERLAENIQKAFHAIGVNNDIAIPFINKSSEKFLGIYTHEEVINNFRLTEYQADRIYNRTIVENFYTKEQINEFKKKWIKKMDKESKQFIFIIGMNRSGSTWTFNIVRNILEPHGQKWDFGYHGEGEALDSYLKTKQKNGEKCVVKFHKKTEYVDLLLRKGDGIAIYTQRDMRDVAVSLMDFLNISFPELLQSGHLDDIIERHEEWCSTPNILRLEYKSIMVTPESEIKGISKFIGCHIDSSTCQVLADQNSADRSNEMSKNINDDQDFESRTLLHANHISCGKFGRYSEVLNDEEVSLLSKKYFNFLEEEGYISVGSGDVMVSNAQNFEDVLLNRIFKGKDNGFYIDVGASDPDFLSVTKWFYDKGWEGINIEPIPELHNRLTLKRPRDINLNIALGAEEGFEEFYESGVTEFSSFNSTRNFNAGQVYPSDTGKTYMVKVETLTDIYHQYADARQIDFLKIDVEGGEKLVLEGLDFTVLRPKVILIEAIQPFEDIQSTLTEEEGRKFWSDWDQLLVDAGYTHIYFDGLNRYYVHASDDDLKKYFMYPVSPVHDHFTMDTGKELDPIQAKLAPPIFKYTSNSGSEDSPSPSYDNLGDDDVKPDIILLGNSNDMLLQNLKRNEKMIQMQSKQLKEKEECIQQQAHQLHEKEDCIKDLVHQLHEKEICINDFVHQLGEKDTCIQEQEKQLQEKEVCIQNQAHQLHEKEAYIQDQAQQMLEKEAYIQAHTQNMIDTESLLKKSKYKLNR